MAKTSLTTSVIICTYNGAKYIEPQLLSVLNQTHKVDEIIVCDDKSTDDTIDIIKKYIAQYPGLIKLGINETNIGGKRNFERALSIANAEIIFFSDQDDIWYSSKVKEYIELFKNDSNISGIFSNAQLVNDDGEKQPYTLWESLGLEIHEADNLNHQGILKYISYFDNIIQGATLAIRKSVLPFILPFQLMDKMWHDEWIGLVLGSKGKLYLYNRILMDYRKHADQQIGMLNRDEIEKRHVLMKGIKYEKKNGAAFFTHWLAAFYRVQAYQRYTTLPEYYEDIRNRLKIARYDKLRAYPFIVRKLKILRWAYYKYADTKFKDIFEI